MSSFRLLVIFIVFVTIDTVSYYITLMLLDQFNQLYPLCILNRILFLAVPGYFIVYAYGSFTYLTGSREVSSVFSYMEPTFDYLLSKIESPLSKPFSIESCYLRYEPSGIYRHHNTALVLDIPNLIYCFLLSIITLSLEKKHRSGFNCFCPLSC